MSKVIYWDEYHIAEAFVAEGKLLQSLHVEVVG